LVSDRVAEQRARRMAALEHAMAMHPAGRGYVIPPIPAFEEAAGEVYAELLDLLVTKQNDYGPHAINRAPGGAINGINVRLHDKYERLRNLTYTGTDPAHESVRDTYRDLANYAVIALMVIDGTWPQ
jgi:hypothetical protein